MNKREPRLLGEIIRDLIRQGHILTNNNRNYGK